MFTLRVGRCPMLVSESPSGKPVAGFGFHVAGFFCKCLNTVFVLFFLSKLTPHRHPEKLISALTLNLFEGYDRLVTR